MFSKPDAFSPILVMEVPIGFVFALVAFASILMNFTQINDYVKTVQESATEFSKTRLIAIE